MTLLNVSPQAFVARLMDERNVLVFELSETPLEVRPRAGWVAKATGIPHHLFYFCRQGSFRAEIAGDAVDLKAGDALWIGPHTPFRLSTDEPVATFLTRFRVRLEAKSGRMFALKPKHVVARNTQGTDVWLEALRQEACLPPTLSRSRRCAVAGLLTMAFLRQEGMAVRAAAKRELTPAQIRIVSDWLENLPTTARPDSAAMARRLHLSRDYVNRLCHASFGMSAEGWLIRWRVRSAAQRLHESALNVSQVAEEYGYSSVYFFSRQFRQVMGCSPSEWKLRGREV